MSLNQKYAELKLGIVCPMANERNTAERFIEEVLAVCAAFHFKSIQFYAVLDRVSTDGTLDILKDMVQRCPSLKVIFAPENRNVVDAYKRGYNEAISDGVDWVLEIDAGFSHDPKDIPKFFEAMAAGKYDCVFGSRFSRGGRFEKGAFKSRFISFGGTQLVNILLGTKLSDMTSGFELFKASALAAILKRGILSRGPFFQTEIKVFAHHFKITEVPIIYSPTPHDHPESIMDAFKNLMRLCRERFKNIRTGK